MRTRSISVGQLRTFEAVARHLSFSAAAEEMALTQSAVSRQIQSLEEEVGVSLFLRHTRSVELTSAGAQLLIAVSKSLPRIDNAVRQIRQSTGRRTVWLSTFATFASSWLIPRLEDFERENPDIDIRVDTSENGLETEAAKVDLVLRYGQMQSMPSHAVRLFGEQLTPAVSPRRLESGPPLKKASDVAQFTLVETGDGHPTYSEWLTWRQWFEEHDVPMLQPKRWLYFSSGDQRVQAALAGQGIVLARLPFILESLANGELIEPLPKLRMDSPLAYWLVIGQHNVHRPEVRLFCEWLMAQGKITRQTSGEAPDPATTES